MGPVTVKVTELVEAFVYVWERALANVFDVEPSPKPQKRLVMVPVEESVKVTVNGLRPIVGLAEKLAVGTNAPVPVTRFEALPMLEVNNTAFVKAAAFVGANWTIRLVEPKPGRVKGEPERMVKTPGVTEAEPLVMGAPPRLVRTKLAWAFEPTTKKPKFSDDGEIPSCGGVRPMPESVLVEFPPLLRKTAELVKLPALVGAKLTRTFVIAKGATLKGVPFWMLNGWVVETLPVSVKAPALVSWKLSKLFWPMSTLP